MDENIIPPRGNVAENKGDSTIVPPRAQKDENSNEIPRENIIPPRGVKPETPPEQPKFKPKLSKLQFFAELSLIFIVFDLFPFLLTFIDIGVITTVIVEPIKWGLAFLSWGIIVARAFILKIPSPKNKFGSLLKKAIAPVIELIPVLNGFVPGWTFQYALTFIPVTFDVVQIIKKGGKFAKIISWIPGVGTEIGIAAKAIAKGAEAAQKE